MRVVVHFDLDAFYASVEELDHPEYIGHPLVVGADPREGHGRGVVTTANYAARAFGIRSAMPISEAWRLCPTARFVRGRFDRYGEMSDVVFNVVREACEVVEPAGIDEGYFELTGAVETFAQAIERVRALQNDIKERTRLSVSFGVGTSKTVAKVATDMRKPFGLTAVPPGTEAEFLAPLPIRKIPGVGPKSEERLLDLGIQTCAQLAEVAASTLTREFGAWGPRLAQLARGVDETPLETSWERKSLGSESTYLEDVSDPKTWRDSVDELAREVAASLVEEKLVARTVTVKVRLVGFETYTRARTLSRATDDPNILSRLALDLLEAHPPTRAVRLLGVRLTHLSPREGPAQRALDDWDAQLLGEAPGWRPSQRRLDET